MRGGIHFERVFYRLNAIGNRSRLFYRNFHGPVAGNHHVDSCGGGDYGALGAGNGCVQTAVGRYNCNLHGFGAFNSDFTLSAGHGDA